MVKDTVSVLEVVAIDEIVRYVAQMGFMSRVHAIVDVSIVLEGVKHVILVIYVFQLNNVIVAIVVIVIIVLSVVIDVKMVHIVRTVIIDMIREVPLDVVHLPYEDREPAYVENVIVDAKHGSHVRNEG